MSILRKNVKDVKTVAKRMQTVAKQRKTMPKL
jgi:hypothetical protein